MNLIGWSELFTAVVILLLLTGIAIRAWMLRKNSQLTYLRSGIVISLLVASYICYALLSLGAELKVPAWGCFLAAAGIAFVPNLKTIRNVQAASSVLSLSWAVKIQVLCGSLLLMVGIARLCLRLTPINLLYSHRTLFLPLTLVAMPNYLFFPWLLLGLMHLVFAWTIWKRLKWYWFPNLLLLMLWAVSPIYAMALISFNRSGPPAGVGSGGVGVGIGGILFMFQLYKYVAIPIFLLIFQWTVLLQRRDWIGSSDKDKQLLLVQVLCCCVLALSLIGIDLIVPLQSS